MPHNNTVSTGQAIIFPVNRPVRPRSPPIRSSELSCCPGDFESISLSSALWCRTGERSAMTSLVVDEPTPKAARPRRGERRGQWSLIRLVVAVFAVLAWQRRWVCDGGLIVLRTVQNLLDGNGPVFNAGERVEAN